MPVQRRLILHLGSTALLIIGWLAGSTNAFAQRYVWEDLPPAMDEGTSIQATLQRVQADGPSSAIIEAGCFGDGMGNNDDFLELPLTVDYGADENRKVITLTAIADGIPEGGELTGISINDIGCNTLGVNDADGDLIPEVWIESATDGAEGGQSPTLVMKRDQTDFDLAVAYRIEDLVRFAPDYKVSEVAIPGIDYKEPDGLSSSGLNFFEPVGVVYFPAGEDTTRLEFEPIDDMFVGEGDEAITVTIYRSDWTDFFTTRREQSTATVRLQDNDDEASAEVPVITVIGEVARQEGSITYAASAVENTGEKGTFQIRRQGPSEQALSVPVTWRGTAVAGTHFVALPKVAEFGPGETELVWEVEAIDDIWGTCAAGMHPEALAAAGSSLNNTKSVFLDIEPASDGSYLVGREHRGLVNIRDRPDDFEDIICLFDEVICSDMSPVEAGSEVEFAARVGMAQPGKNEKLNLVVAWDFGDGTESEFSTDRTISHTYTEPGTYQGVLHMAAYTVNPGTFVTVERGGTCADLKNDLERQCQVATYSFEVTVAEAGQGQPNACTDRIRFTPPLDGCTGDSCRPTPGGSNPGGTPGDGGDPPQGGSENGSGTESPGSGCNGPDCPENPQNPSNPATPEIGRDASDSNSDTGCGCQTTSTPALPGSLLFLLVALGVWQWRRSGDPE